MQINAQFVLIAMVASSAAAAPIRMPWSSKPAGGGAPPAAGGSAASTVDSPAAPAKEPKTFYDTYDKHGSKINAVGAVTAGGMAIGAGVLAHEASQANDAAAAATAAKSSDPAAAVRRSEDVLRRAGPHRSGSVSSEHSGNSSPGGSVYGTPMGSPMSSPPNSRPGSPVNTPPAPPAAPAAAPANAASTTDAEKAKAAAKTKNGAINNMMGTGGAIVGLVGGGVALDNAVNSNNEAQAKQAAAQQGGDPAANVRRSPLTPMNIAANLGMGMMMGGGGGISVSNDKQDYTQQFMSQGAKHTGASSRRSEDSDLLGKRLIPISTSSTKYSQVSQGMEQGPSHTGASSGGGSADFWASGGSAMPGRQQQAVMAKRLIPISTSSSHSEQVAQGLQQGPSHTGATSGSGSAQFWATGGSAMPPGQGSGMASAVKYGQVQQQRRDTSQLLFRM